METMDGERFFFEFMSNSKIIIKNESQSLGYPTWKP